MGSLPNGRKSAEEMNEERRANKAGRRKTRKVLARSSDVSVFKAAAMERNNRDAYLQKERDKHELRERYRMGQVVNTVIAAVLAEVDVAGFKMFHVSDYAYDQKIPVGVLKQAFDELEAWMNRGCNQSKVKYACTWRPQQFIVARLADTKVMNGEVVRNG